MAKTINARVKQKTATEPQWLADTTVLLEGEQAFVVNSNGTPVNFKIGDGTKTFAQLPYWIAYDQAAYVVIPNTNVLPTPPNNIGYSIVKEGTYTKTGQPNLVIPSGNMGIIAYVGGVWVIQSIVLLPPAENKIPDWVAGTYTMGQQVIDEGQIWSVAVASTTKKPGDGVDWVAKTEKGRPLNVIGGVTSFDEFLQHIEPDSSYDFSYDSIAINASTGIVTVNAAYSTSKLILLAKGDTIKIGINSNGNMAFSAISLYSISKVWVRAINKIGDIPNNSFGIFEYTAVENCYVRASNYKSGTAGTVFIGVIRVSDIVDPNKYKAISSKAVLDHFQVKEPNEYKPIAPLIIKKNKAFINASLVDDVNTDAYFFEYNKDLYLSGNPMSDVNMQRVWFLNSNFITTNSASNYLNIFNLNINNIRKKLNKNRNEPFIVINFRKDDTSKNTESYNPYSKINTNLINNELYKSCPTVKVFRDTLYNGKLIPSLEYDYHIIAVDKNETIQVSYDMPASNSVGAMLLLNKNQKSVGVYPFNAFYFNDKINNLKIDLSTFRFEEISYVGFNVKKTDNIFKIKGIIKGSYQFKYNRINFKNYIPHNIGETLLNTLISDNGVKSSVNGTVSYILNIRAIQDGTLNIYPAPENNYAVVLDSGLNFIRKINLTGTANGNPLLLDSIDGQYIAFSSNTLMHNEFWIQGYLRDDLYGNIFNFHDYINTGTKTHGLETALTNLIDYVNSIGGGTIFIPSGIYYLKDSVYLKSNVNLVGEDKYKTIFKPIGYINAFIASSTSINTLNNCVYENFTIDGEMQTLSPSGGYSPFIKGFYMKFVEKCIFRDLVIKNTGATGLGVDFWIDGTINNIIAENCGRLADLSSGFAGGASGIGIGTGNYNRGCESLIISNCFTNNNKQNGIFVEINGAGNIDRPVGSAVIGCSAEGNRIGFGCSGSDGTLYTGCTAFRNHHAGFAYDTGTLLASGTTGVRAKYIGCVAKETGINMPIGYPEFAGERNGFGWYILANTDGVELTNCDSQGNLRSGLVVELGPLVNERAIVNMYINGGSFVNNREHGIEINGRVNKFKISPSIVEKNLIDGIRINANMTNGFIKDSIITENINGINKVSGTLTNVIVKDNLVYENSGQNLINITQI